MKRRDFVGKGMALLTYIKLQCLAPEKREVLSAVHEKIPQRRLGRTGNFVGLFSLGGEALVEDSFRQREAVEVIHRALDLGVNYVDTAPIYGGGGSEENIGMVMKERRGEVFLASKTDSRTYDGTMRLFEESLKRLQTDYLDLYQLHNIRLDRDLQEVFKPHGAVEALEELRSQGAIRFTGITGHKDPDVLLRGIKQYPFDCILLSLNAADIHYAPFQTELLAQAVEKEMGIIAMKTMARGRIFNPEGVNTAREALWYVFSLPISTAIVGISNLQELKENVQLAKEFTSMTEQERSALAEKTRSYQRDCNFFKYSW